MANKDIFGIKKKVGREMAKDFAKGAADAAKDPTGAESFVKSVAETAAAASHGAVKAGAVGAHAIPQKPRLMKKELSRKNKVNKDIFGLANGSGMASEYAEEMAGRALSQRANAPEPLETPDEMPNNAVEGPKEEIKKKKKEE